MHEKIKIKCRKEINITTMGGVDSIKGVYEKEKENANWAYRERRVGLIQVCSEPFD